MRRFFTTLFLLSALPAFAGAAEYEDCILSKMPGVANDITAQAIVVMCKKEYPRPNNVAPGKRTGWFDYKSGAECAAKKGKSTASRVGGGVIFAACNALYERPNPFDRFDRVVPFSGKLDDEK